MMLDDAHLKGSSQRRYLLKREKGVSRSQCQYLGRKSAEERKERISVRKEPWHSREIGMLCLLAQDVIPIPAHPLL